MTQTREERKAKVRAYYLANHEKHKSYARAYYADHREEKILYSRSYSSSHAETHRARSRAWNASHPQARKALAQQYYASHPEEMRAKNRAYYSNNREKEKIRKYKCNKALRTKILMHYGGKCACCGESIYEFLAIDHINGGGHKHHKEIGIGSGQKYYRWFIKNNFPDGFQVLCHNCNMAKGFYGVCPHQTKAIQ